MSTIGDQYILGGRSDHDRLRVISEIHDDRTRELLLQAGLAPGHRFVEFGCGLGYVTRWVACQGGHATGIDVNEEQVKASAELAREAGLRNAEFRVASIHPAYDRLPATSHAFPRLHGRPPSSFLGERSG